MPDPITIIDRHEVQQLVQKGAQLIEVLSEQAYQEIHLSGAENIPLERLDGESAARLRNDQPVILYCGDYQ